MLQEIVREDLAAESKMVLAAAEVLDEKGPEDWRERIDPSTLEVASCSECVLGQIFGGYHLGLKALDIGPHHYRMRAFSGITHRAMTAAWLNYLAEEG
jgi:hypothetical protein